MSALKISLFGGLDIEHQGHPYAGPLTRTVQALLAYLLLHRQRPHPRAVLAGLLWGNVPESQARKRLSTILWRVRQVLEPSGVTHGTYLLTTPEGIGFNPASDYLLDVAQFEAAIGASLTHPAVTLSGEAVAALEQAVQLYTGELLVGLYDDWALRERERLKSLYVDCLTHLLQYYRHHGQVETSLAYGRQILAQEPWREEVHRILMQLYLEQGQRADAIHQYETCQQILRTELDVAPMAETQALYEQALVHPVVGSAPSGQLVPVLDQLRQMQQHVTALHIQLAETIERLRRLVQGGEEG